MKYVSTRDASSVKAKVSASEAICRGLAPDGGLYVPESIPSISGGDIEHITSLPYAKRAAYVLSLFFEEFTEDELIEMCEKAYSSESFPDGAAPGAASYAWCELPCYR